jgi:pilus assembly protein CpaB
MNRRNRTLVVVAVAVLLAGLATYHAVVAKQPIPAGSLITADQIQLVAWPADSPVAGGFTKTEDVVGRGLLSSVNANEPLTESRLAAKGQSGLPPLITPGMRAVAVRVNDIIGVAGFVVPGSRVDVIVTLKPENGVVSRDVLSNVQVLTSGTTIANDQQVKEGKAMAASVVTVLVSPQDAERLALAQDQGSIVLALRNPLDTDPTQTQGARMASLLGGAAPPPEMKVVKGQTRAVAPPPPPPAPKPYTVETIKGNKRAEEIIK